MNAGLTDGTTAGDLLLQQAKIVPQPQYLSDLAHGQGLLGHSVPPLAQRRNLQPVVQRRILLPIRKLDPETLISFRVPPCLTPNPYPHPSGTLIHMPRNMHLSDTENQRWPVCSRHRTGGSERSILAAVDFREAGC